MWDEYDRHGWGWEGWLGMGLMMLLFWVLLVAAIFLLLRWFRSGSSGEVGTRPEQDSAERLLAERFARGEIDEEEYRRRRGVLHGG